jgi:hypothetical protein
VFGLELSVLAQEIVPSILRPAELSSRIRSPVVRWEPLRPSHNEALRATAGYRVVFSEGKRLANFVRIEFHPLSRI